MMATSGIDEITAAQIGLLIGELFLPVPIFIWARNYQIDMRRLFRLNPVSISSIIASIPLAVGLTIITDEFDRVAQSLVAAPEGFSKIQEIMTITDPLSAFFIIGVVIIIAPFIEELIFRGFFQRILEYRFNDVTKAVLYSALTFAIIHFNPWWVVQIYIIGIFMGYVAWRTNSIWISFILHAINIWYCCNIYPSFQKRSRLVRMAGTCFPDNSYRRRSAFGGGDTLVCPVNSNRGKVEWGRADRRVTRKSARIR